MAEKNTNLRNNVIGIYLNNKYWVLGSTIFFLLAASVYLILTPVSYKVSNRIILKTNQDPEAIIRNVKSKALLQKVINQIPLQVAYYQEAGSKATEISQESLPIKFVPAENTVVNSTAEIKVFVVNNQQYKILKDRTFMYFLFDEPVNYYSFAKFKITRGPGFKTAGVKSSTIRIYSDDYLLNEFGKNLDAKFVEGDHQSIELSLQANSLKKGKDFLDKLVEVYNASGSAASISNVPENVNPETIRLVKYELASLKIKAENFKYQQAILSNSEEKATGDKALTKAEGERFLNVLNEIEPYVKTSINQFVLIPDVYVIDDGELNKLITQFNKLQTQKQHVLQVSQSESSKIGVLNTQLITLKQTLVEKIDALKNGLNGVQKSPSTSASTAVNDSLSRIKNLLSAKQAEYNNLLNSQAKKIETGTANPNDSAIEKSAEHVNTYPEIWYVYLFALLIGMVFPLIIPYFKLRLNL